MDLKSYLKKTGMRQTAFAALLGVSDPVVSQWIAGQRIPSRANMRAIHQATGGEVTPMDFYGVA